MKKSEKQSGEMSAFAARHAIGGPSAHGVSARKSSRFQGKRPVFQFVILFGVFMGAFQLACASALMKETIFPTYLRFNAQVSGAILRLFEDAIHVTGQSISGRYSLTLERGCDAIEPSALFLSGVLAFPSALLKKVPGMMIGTFILMVLNLVRIVSLYFVGVYVPSWFEFMHVSVWQAMFIFLAIVFWVLWALWALRVQRPMPDVSATTS